LWAYFEGGDASMANRVVQGAMPPDELAGPAAVVHCGFGGLSDCENEFINAVSWLSSDELSESEKARPVDLFLGTTSWAEAGVDRNFDVPVQVVVARLNADDLMEDSVACFERTEELAAMSAVTDDFRKQLPDIHRTCRQNVYVLEATAVRACYDK